MNLEKVLISLGSAVAVLALIAIAWGLGFRRGARLESEEAARKLIAEEAPGATIQNVLLDKRGAGALAELADNRLVVVRAMGDRFSARTMPAGGARISRTETGVRIAFADLGFPELHLELDAPPPAWLGARL